MLRDETVLGLLDLSQMRGIKPACAKFALKGVPKEKQSCAIMPRDGREPTAGLPMRAPRFYRERSHSPRKRFLSNRSLTTTQSSRVGHSPKGAGTSERSHRLFAGCGREPGGGTMEKGGTRWETKARRIRTRLGNRR